MQTDRKDGFGKKGMREWVKCEPEESEQDGQDIQDTSD